MARINRLLKLAAGAFAFLLYVWFAAVRYAARVKRRKEARRAGRAGLSHRTRT